MHIFCWRDWRSKAVQQLNGRNMGAEDAMAGYMRVVCSDGEALLGCCCQRPEFKLQKARYLKLFWSFDNNVMTAS